MNALLLTPDQSAALLAGIVASYAARDLAPYWLPMPMPVLSGPYAGQVAIDIGPEALSMEMIGGMTLAELPDFTALMASLGNPAPVDLDDALVRPPVAELPESPPPILPT
jgi:hypothetical protein